MASGGGDADDERTSTGEADEHQPTSQLSADETHPQDTSAQAEDASQQAPEQTAPAESPEDFQPPPGSTADPVLYPLFAGLDSGGETAAKCGIAICLVARNQPEKVSRIVGNLVERAADQPKSEPVLRTLAALAGEHGCEIRGALMTKTSYGDARRIYGYVERVRPWSLADFLDEDDEPTEDAEETILPSVMRLVELDEEGHDLLDTDAFTNIVKQLPGEGGESAGEEAIDAAAAREDTRARSVRRRAQRLEEIAKSRTFRTIEAQSRFDELDVLSRVRSRQYADVIRTQATEDARQFGIEIRLYHRDQSPECRRLLVDRFREWSRLDTGAIVTVADWGDDPRPWLATEFVDTRLPEKGALTTEESLEHARALTGALASIHQRGMVHGAIDPGNVGYPPNTLDRVVEPMLDNVGIMPAYRQLFEPQEYLDIRYAAPEWFDGQYGNIDHTSDVYQLGAVLYRALTGVAPFDGTAEEVETAIRGEQPPPPSTVTDDLPPMSNDIIAKAMAKRKLTRYENVTRFHQDVSRLCEEVLE